MGKYSSEHREAQPFCAYCCFKEHNMCMALRDNRFADGKCPFHKTQKEQDESIAKSEARLREIGYRIGAGE